MTRAIVNDSAFGRELEAALLLVLGPALELAIAKDLEIDEAQADDDEPEA
jgi:hypothetical protein